MCNIDIDKIGNPYDLTDEQSEKMFYIINDYFHKIYNLKNDSLYDNLQLGSMLAISESYFLMKDKTFWDDYIYNIMVNIKNNLLGGNVRGLGFFDGYAQIGSIIKNYSKITGQYQKFTCTFEQLFVNNVKELLKEYTSKKYEVKTAAFDVISGMAGIVQYLLELDAKITKEVLYEASIYLGNLTEEVMYKNRKVPGWFVAGNNILVEMERKRYPNGQVNYGFAHGITGVLASLIKLGENGINKSKVDESIKRILSEIKKVEYVSDEGIYFYPGLLDIENYIDGKYYDGTNLRMSWCYGSISILYTLYRAYYYIKDYDSCEKILNSIEIIAQKGNNCWKLESPIICHGFAGTALVLCQDLVQVKMRFSSS